MEIERLIELYPRLYHMAERGTWESIRQRGLFSASAVLDHFGLVGADRASYESMQRPAKVEIVTGHPASIVLRDQKPMPHNRLLVALQDGITPEEWYRTINAKVFFWATRERLLGLLNARDYRNMPAYFIEEYVCPKAFIVLLRFLCRVPYLTRLSAGRLKEKFRATH
jgi:hypothetical protein